MWLTIERKTDGSDRIADPLTETVNRKTAYHIQC